MAYVMFNRNELGIPHVIRRYDTRKGAVIGMRAANRNAGWTRISMCSGGICEMEWCAKTNGLPVYEYAPYVIAHEVHFEEKYRLNELVEVKSLMSGQTVMIPRRDKGTCVDPSQERYWSM